MKYLLYLFLLPLSQTLSAQYSGKVVAIADGDTFTILRENNQQEKIRLFGIDCPEKGQPYGRNAKLYLSQLIFNKTVQITFKNKDRYRRSVAIVYFNNICINEELLKKGWAWHFKRYDKTPAWSTIEEEARKAKRGLWVDANAMAPWDWRR